ncbi:MAG: T9SS type A sorting domain-containing protein, partial [Bacteroidota bacterium]|nr:T9SS type A sorting domain-containing protein [Bacteroidota bacterium]
PTRDILNVKSRYNITHITMMNNVGQLVYNKKVSDENVLEINVTGYDPGVYMIKIETKDDIIIEKVLITR